MGNIQATLIGSRILSEWRSKEVPTTQTILQLCQGLTKRLHPNNQFNDLSASRAQDPACMDAAYRAVKHVEEIRTIILSFLRGCQIQYPIVSFDCEFGAACYAEALRRGYSMDGTQSLRLFIPGGAAMATTAYSHLSNKSTRMVISLYTAFLIYLDDIFQDDVEAVMEFNERFISHDRQMDRVLDDFAALLLDMPRHFGRVVSNLIVTSTLNLVTALLLEHDTQGMQLRDSAAGYPNFSRVMSGASEAYSLFVFPPELQLKSYIQALPEMMIFINNGNDILSFHKEQFAGETVNRVSILAGCYHISKFEVLQDLGDAAVEAHHRVLNILAPNKASYDAYQQFSVGYIGFHAALSRYRLNELAL